MRKVIIDLVLALITAGLFGGPLLYWVWTKGI